MMASSWSRTRCMPICSACSTTAAISELMAMAFHRNTTESNCPSLASEHLVRLQPISYCISAGGGACVPAARGLQPLQQVRDEGMNEQQQFMFPIDSCMCAYCFPEPAGTRLAERCAVRRNACCISCHSSRAAKRVRGWAFPSLMARDVVSPVHNRPHVEAAGGRRQATQASVLQSAYYTVRFSIVLPSPQVRCGTHWWAARRRTD